MSKPNLGYFKKKDLFDIPNDSKYLDDDLRAELIERDLVLFLDVVYTHEADYWAGFFDADGEEVDIEGFNATDEAFEFFTNDDMIANFIERAKREAMEF